MNGWISAKLGELCTIVGGGTPERSNPDFYDGDIPWVTPKDMKTWEISGSKIHITKAGLENSATRLVPGNTVLVVVRSGVLKHTIPVGINRCAVAINQDMKGLICGNQVYPDFLAYFLKERSHVILQWVRATTADNFPIDKLRELDVPLPPMSEQRRIVDILDKVDALRAKRRAALAQLDALSQSIFVDMFGDPATNPRGWPVQSLAQLGTDFRYGTSKKSADAGKPTLRIPNVVHGSINLDDLKSVPVSGAEFVRLQLHDGDLLFVRTNGNPDFVGRCAVFDKQMIRVAGFEPTDFIFASYLIRARISADKICPYFLCALLQGAEGRKQMRARCKTSAGQYNINIEGLGAIRLSIPPMNLQCIFFERLRAVDTLKEVCRTAIEELDRAFRSLRHRAFRGELTADKENKAA
ncbi:MAG: restriction endonuclease subunit S [Stellaceae bacterium]